ncbi:MAG: efflux transporter outer membrane subunit [Burkholderiaceae bacterium]
MPSFRTELPRFRRLRPPLALAVCLLLGACAAPAPDAAPCVPLSTAWKSAPPPGWISTADAPAAWQEGRWWALFADPQLDSLMQGVEVGNQNLAQAVASVAQAQALLRQAEAQLGPMLGAQLSAQRSGQPAAGSATLGLTASWAPDLWGRLADSVRAQGARVQASQADLAAARLAAQGSLASAYFRVREADVELQLLDDIITGYRRAVTITQNRYQAGVAAHTDLLQAQSTLENALGSRAALQASRDTSEQAIALLIGQPPAQFTLARAPWQAAVPALPLDMPSELLLRRPDVASAERAVVAANASIGAARAAYFPSLNLSAGLGGKAGSLATLASAPTLAWSLGAALAQTLFDAGARDAAVEQARAAHQAATANYRQSVLTALGQVENQMTTMAALATQIEHAHAAALAAHGAEQRILNSYQAGLSAYTDVVTAQANALGARRSELQLQLQRQQAAVGLVQALGGGWQAPWRAAAS